MLLELLKEQVYWTLVFSDILLDQGVIAQSFLECSSIIIIITRLYKCLTQKSSWFNILRSQSWETVKNSGQTSYLLPARLGETTRVVHQLTKYNCLAVLIFMNALCALLSLFPDYLELGQYIFLIQASRLVVF